MNNQKLLLFLSVLNLFFFVKISAQNITITDDINYSAESSAILDIKSTSKGMLVPRLSSNQRHNISSPVTGLLVFDTNYSSFFYFDGSNWRNLLTDVVGVTEDPNIALFSVVNYNGDTVLAVYPNAVEISFDSSSTKAARGGFAISGRGATKETSYDYLRVTPDSTRIYVDEDQGKAARGGFAISGRGATKQVENDLLYVDLDTTTVSTVLNTEDNIIVSGEIFDADGGLYEPSDSVTDYDGNSYATVIIGNQIWMDENLRTTHYSDGTALIDGTGAGDISGNDSTKYYFWYLDSVEYANTYGALYTWAAIMNKAASSNSNPSGIQGICPKGWHVPSYAEWSELSTYLADNGYGFGGSGTDIAKSLATTTGWLSSGTLGHVGNNQASNNSSGYTAVPVGSRSGGGTYADLGVASQFWTATEYSGTQAWKRYIRYDFSDFFSYENSKDAGLSIRCIKD